MTSQVESPEFSPRGGTASRGQIGRGVEATGDFLLFAAKAIAAIPRVIRYDAAEVLRHSGTTIRSHLPVVLFLAGMLGVMMAITGSFVFEGVGLDSYVAIIIAIPMVRGVLAIVFGWVFAAKAGCGMVAELGAMRIGEEIDALDVMGVQSVPYLVATRLASSLIVVPFMYTIALGLHFAAAQFFFTDFLGTVSPGGFSSLLYLLQSPRDLAFSISTGAVVGFVVTLISCYFGYNASGGPVGVGRSTAQAMLWNLIVNSLIVMLMVQAVYGGDTAAPVGT